MSIEHHNHLGKLIDSTRTYPTLGRMLGSHNAGIMLSRLLLLEGTMKSRKDGYFYRTVEALEKESGLTRHQQAAAKKILEDAGLIHCKIAGSPGRRYFKVDTEMLHIQLTRWLESHPSDRRKSANKKAHNQPTYKDSEEVSEIDSTVSEVDYEVLPPRANDYNAANFLHHSRIIETVG